MMVESLQESRVLVVEDESLIAEELRDRLERMGVEVVATVAAGEDAVTSAGNLHPDIILMDIRLRGRMDGVEAAARIGELYQIPVVYLTAHSDDATLLRAKRTEPYGYLLKPFEERDLRITLEMALFKHSAEKKLHQSRELYSKTLSGIAEGVIATDEQARITFMNQAAERLTEWNMEDVRGRIISEILSIVHPPPHLTLQEVTDRVLQFGERLVLDEAVMVTREGRQVYIGDTASPIHDARQNVRGMVLVVRDLTEQKRSQQAMRDAEMRLQQMQKMEAIGRLAGGIAHDVNNMMTIIRCNGDLILEKPDLDEAQRKRVDSMRQAAERSSTLARQLLAFSRKQVLKTVALDLNGIVFNMEQMLRSLLGAEIRIDTRLMPGISAVMADSAQLEQVLMNLVINARDAMPRGGSLCIETDQMTLSESRAELPELPDLKPGPYVVLRVSDSGIGMPTDVMPHIFEPFFTTKEVGKGTGMGLATVFGIVAQFNGSIRVRSVEGQGTTFEVYLPACGLAVTNRVSGIYPAKPVARETVLLVEDEPELRELVSTFLLDQNYRVLEASDGLEALALAEKEPGPIHLLLTDAIMPHISGKALADKLIETRPEMELIFMSGYTEDCLADRSMLKAGWGFVQKPFSKADLLKAVTKVLARKARKA
jgi:two-component system, cell cycle sensor histidine kinase and response regulator CckA